jgi:hypothetical protein
MNGVTWVQNNYNSIFGFFSIPMDTNNLNLGIVASSVNINDGKLVCTFVRENTNSYPNYIRVDSINRLYVLSAYGSGNVSFHGSNAAVSSTPIVFLTNSNDTNTTTSAPKTVQNVITEFIKKVIAWFYSLFNKN